VRALRRPLTTSLVHARNVSRRPLDVLVAERLDRWRHQCDVVARHLGSRGMDADPSAWLAVNDDVRSMCRILAGVSAISRVTADGDHVVLLDAGEWQAGMAGPLSARWSTTRIALAQMRPDDVCGLVRNLASAGAVAVAAGSAARAGTLRRAPLASFLSELPVRADTPDAMVWGLTRSRS